MPVVEPTPITLVKMLFPPALIAPQGNAPTPLAFETTGALVNAPSCARTLVLGALLASVADAADIVYAVTNEKGKNRAERANDKYYAGIVATPGAVFVKLCDRIANVQYGKMTGSGMYDKYKKENDNFIIKLGYDDTNTHEYFEMFVYLVNLFKD